MNYTFFAAFTVAGAIVTALYLWPVFRRQLGWATLVYAIGGLLGAFYVPQESTDVAVSVIVLCFCSFSFVMLVIERDSQLTGIEDGISPQISRQEYTHHLD